MKRAVTALLAFVAGLLIGMFLSVPSRKRPSSTPIAVDFCFLADNLGLFEEREVATSARIVVSMHGESLWSDNCPKSGLPFRSKLRSDAVVQALNSRLHLGADVPVTFFATVDSPSPIYNLGHWMRGHQSRSNGIKITKIVSVGSDPR